MHFVIRTMLMGLGWLQGDWAEARKKTRKINLIEPVVEGTLQLFFQSTILYVTFHHDSDRPFDISSILFTDQTSSRVRFLLSFFSSFLSVGIGFSRLLTQGRRPVIKHVVSLQFLKILMIIVTKFIMQSYMLSISIQSLMYKFISKFRYFPKPSYDSGEFRELEEKYYRGLCVNNISAEFEFHCEIRV